MSTYDKAVILERIDTAMAAAGYKTVSSFTKAIGVSPSAYTNWKKRGNTPELPVLIDICNVCGCDIDYLLGKISCKTRETTDIQKETGLSEKACNIIMCKHGYEHFTEDRKQEFREFLLQEQSVPVSWFIEHGLIDIVSRITSIIQSENPKYNLISFIPPEYRGMLSDSFDIALQYRKINGRKFEYTDRIALYLINTPRDKIAALRKELQESTVYGNECDIYEFTDFDDYVEHEADRKKISAEDRDIIAEVAQGLAALSFDYFQAKYETQLNIQIAVNKFNDLINQYRNEQETKYTD